MEHWSTNSCMQLQRVDQPMTDGVPKTAKSYLASIIIFNISDPEYRELATPRLQMG